MTREEAIARIELSATEMVGTLAATTEPSAADVLKRYIDAYDLAIAALREQEERNKGCRFCADAKYIDGEFTAHCVVAGDGHWYIDERSGDVMFCPMCGRRLEEV